MLAESRESRAQVHRGECGSAGTKGEAPDTDESAPTGHRASPRPYQARTIRELRARIVYGSKQTAIALEKFAAVGSPCINAHGSRVQYWK